MLDHTKRVTAYRYLALTAAVVALAGTLAAAPARAADISTVTVRYSDLDLTGWAGEAALKDRVARAARQVCGMPDGRTIADFQRVADCRANAVAEASPKLDRVIASARSDHRYAMNDDAIAIRGD